MHWQLQLRTHQHNATGITVNTMQVIHIHHIYKGVTTTQLPHSRITWLLLMSPHYTELEGSLLWGFRSWVMCFYVAGQVDPDVLKGILTALFRWGKPALYNSTTSCVLDMLLGPNEGSRFLWNVTNHSLNTALHPRTSQLWNLKFHPS